MRGERALCRCGVCDRRRAARQPRASRSQGNTLRPPRRRNPRQRAPARQVHRHRPRSASSLASLGLGHVRRTCRRRVDRSVVWIRSALTGWITAHTVGERGRHRGADIRAHRASARWCRRRSRCRAPTRTALWVSPAHREHSEAGAAARRCARWHPANAGARAAGVQRRRRRRRALPLAPKSCSSSSRKARSAGLLRGESGRILSELFEFGDLTAGPGDGAARAPGLASASAPPPTNCGTSSGRGRTRGFRSHTGDPDDIVGSVHIKDLLRHVVSNQPVTPIRRPSCSLHSDDRCRLMKCWTAMRRTRAQMAVVMDEHGGTAGIVTIEDLFEEVVGEIDEGRGRTPIWREASGQAARARHREAEGRRRRDRQVARASGGSDDQRSCSRAARASRCGWRCR